MILFRNQIYTTVTMCVLYSSLVAKIVSLLLDRDKRLIHQGGMTWLRAYEKQKNLKKAILLENMDKIQLQQIQHIYTNSPVQFNQTCTSFSTS